MILKASQQMGEQIQSISHQLQLYPEGKLICTNNGKYKKWYQYSDSTLSYIPKKNKKLAEQLAEKKYLTLKLDILKNEKRLLDYYLAHHISDSERKDNKFLTDSRYQELLTSFISPDDQNLNDWQKELFKSNPKHPEQLVIKTCSGFCVRSKSEALIDIALCMHQIPHRYECALELGGVTVYPDFTLRHPRTGKIFYWEHFGLMDDSTYCHKMANKLKQYAINGIIPSINLITTYETKEYPLSPEVIEQTIKTYFGENELGR